MRACVRISGHLSGDSSGEINSVIAWAGIFVTVRERQRFSLPGQGRGEKEIPEVRAACPGEMVVAETNYHRILVMVAGSPVGTRVRPQLNSAERDCSGGNCVPVTIGPVKHIDLRGRILCPGARGEDCHDDNNY